MQLPERIGRYEVGRLIGTGAFSAVYQATDPRIGCEVAIKLLADHHSLDPDIRERFIAEARLLRRVNNPRVVRLYDLDETERLQPFLVMELVAGGNLAAVRAEAEGSSVAVGPADVMTVADEVTAALTALHEQRIVHRDLSPRNLLVRRGADTATPPRDRLIHPGDTIVLADLGLSKDLAASSGLTAAAGTDGFAAPEQRSAGVVDERADVYAASALLTWLALGRSDVDEPATAIRSAGWPEAFGAVLARGRSVDPAARPATIAAWHAAVRAALDPPPPAPAWQRSSARRWVAIAAAALLAGSAAGYGIAELAGSDDPPATTVIQGDDGSLRAEHADGELVAAFGGPATLTVGERATFTADVAGAVSWLWLGAGGQVVPDEPRLAITPTSAGQLDLALVAIAADGTSVTASATLTVAG